jgi:hypothetical protein
MGLVMRMSKLARLALAGLLGMLASGPAAASVVIDLVQTGFSAQTDGFGDGQPPTFSARLVVEQDDFARGSTPVVFNQPARGPFSSSLDGLLDLKVSIRDPGGSALLVTPLSRFLTPLPPFAPIGFERSFSLALSRSAIFGSIRYNDQESDYRVSLVSDGTFTATFNTDRGGICGRTGNCSFSGSVVVSVPEPSGLAAIAFGTLVLAAAYRRRDAG